MIKIHPFPSFLFLLVIFLMTLIFSNPLYIASIFIFTIINIIILKELKVLRKTFKYSLFTVILIVIVNPLVSNSGSNVIYKSGRLPIIGKINITLEAIAFGGNMALKLLCIFLLFSLYSILSDKDESFSFLSKYVHKLTLILSMTTNIIHKLRFEVDRVKEVMVLRGVKLNDKNFTKRIIAYYPIIKVILISSLEGSIDRAEALHSRSYGAGIRTSYTNLKMNSIDYFVFSISIILAGLTMYCIINGIGVFNFYPRFDEFKSKDLIYLSFIDFILSIYLLIIWRLRKWKFSKLKV